MNKTKAMKSLLTSLLVCALIQLFGPVASMSAAEKSPIDPCEKPKDRWLLDIYNTEAVDTDALKVELGHMGFKIEGETEDDYALTIQIKRVDKKANKKAMELFASYPQEAWALYCASTPDPAK